MKEKTKVVAYIFRNNKQEILVFSHRDMPQAGIQVVGGTVESLENFPSALIREIMEESGLKLEMSELQKIGETKYLRKDRPEVNLRHYYEISPLNLPDSWAHVVHSLGSDNGLVFDFFWLEIHVAKEVLTGNFGELLP
jgi:8-oxo-dGTP pyrophosphatase MutT (NUDIX family)